MFDRYTSDELRVICRSQIEVFEHWARRLIHNKLNSKYGDNYLDSKDENDGFIIKKNIREDVSKRLKERPERYSRPADALLTEDMIDILCNPKLYKSFYKEAVSYYFPDGVDELRTFLSRIITPRNKLTHSNPVSIREAEQVICYTNDFIESLKKHYEYKNLQMSYNVPQIIKVVDSFGQQMFREELTEMDATINWFKRGKNPLRPGDQYSIEITVDHSFNEKDYEISWWVNHENMEDFKNKKAISFKVKEGHVKESFSIS